MTNQGRRSILCPNCRKLIDSDEARCPYCGVAHPGSRWKNNFWTRGVRNPDQLIKVILYVNVGMFVLSLMLNERFSGFSLNPFTTLSPDNTSLFLLGATGTIPIDDGHRWWTLVSANYLHGGIFHILFNMIAFKQIAHLVIREYGLYRMFVLYSLGGIIGFVISYLAGVALTIGASAAVCCLIGSAIYYGKSRGGEYGNAVYRQIGGWAVGIFIFGFIVPGINNWGHGGGIAAGVVLGFLLGYQEKRAESFFHRALAGGCVILTIIVLGWAVTTGIYYRVSG